VIADDAVLTFAELDARSAALAGWLAARTDRGDRVAEQAAQFSTVGTRLVLGDAQYLESLSDTPRVAFGTPEWLHRHVEGAADYGPPPHRFLR